MKNIAFSLVLAALYFVCLEPNAKAASPESDSIQPNSVWRLENKVLTILDRNGETFRARFDVSPNIVREISGTVKGNKISWLAKNTHAIKGKPGHDNFGTIKGDKIDFTYSLNGVPGGPPFTLTRDRSNEKPADQPLLGTTGSPSPALQVTTHKADEPQIKILSEESVNVTGWITAPLDVPVPEQIWENLNFLKEALKDEAAQKPAASAAAYQLGVKLCLKMLQNLEARDTASARAGGNAVLHQRSNLTQQNRDHLTWPQFALERDERAERKDNARKADRFMNGHYAVEWNTNATVMRREIQLFYSQFREALRQK